MRIALILTLLVSAGAAAQDASFLAQQDAERAQERAVERSNRDAQRAEAQAKRAAAMARTDREDGLYRAGTRAIDQRQYEQAVSTFDRVIEAKSSRADGALYWKAYAQNRLGQREQALATLAQLQKEFPQSRWSGDAKALDVEVRQASGRPVSPDNENDEDLKLLAINGLMASDPSRALPPLQKVIADPKASPRVKERALFVVAQSSDPKARDLLLQIAKGGGNPDMQLKAVEYLGCSAVEIPSRSPTSTRPPPIQR